MSHLSIVLHSNGSFDIVNGSLKLIDCYPGMDGRPVRAQRIEVETGPMKQIVYHLENGTITLSFIENDQGISVKTTLSNLTSSPQWFYPIFEAQLLGGAGVYRQGLGFGGPSGHWAISEFDKKKEKVDSFSLVALTASENKTQQIIYVQDHTRFMNKYSLIPVRKEKKEYLFSAGFRIEGIFFSELALPEIFFHAEDDLEQGLRQAAEEIGMYMKSRRTKEPAFHWCSWYYLYHELSHEILSNYLQGFKQKGVPFKYIQIDAGYFTSAGDWLSPNSLWPQGLKAAFDDIISNGYTPGIWIGPFMVGSRSKLYQAHPDWVLRDLEGKPVTEWRYYGEPKVWGLLDEEYYVLDTSHPEAFHYMRMVFRTFRSYGVKLYKTDFMYWGLKDSTEVQRHTPGKTSFEYFRDFLDMIREEIGEESYWLGCIAPYMPFLGYADAMRIAGDVGVQWGGQGFGPENMIQQIVGDNYFNHIYWQNDPDALLLRDFHTFLTPTEVEALALLQAVSGGTLYTSDPVHEIAADRQELLNFIKHTEIVKPEIPLLKGNKKEIVLVHRWPEKGKYLVFFFNPTREEMLCQYDLKSLIGIEEAYYKQWKEEQTGTELTKDLLARIPAHGCQLFFLSTDGTINQPIVNMWEWS